MAPGGVGDLRLERAATVPEQHAHRIVVVIRRHEVRLSIGVEITHDDAHGIVSYRKSSHPSRKSAIAIAGKEAHRVTGGVRRHERGRAGAEDIRHRDPYGPGAGPV